MMNNSKFIVYVDESGDHGLDNIDSDYPVFVLSFCVFLIEDYTGIAVPTLQSLKFKYFGHDQIIFHDHHIRKQEGSFTFLRKDRDLRNNFLNDLSRLIQDIPFLITSVVIDKIKLRERYADPFNPYNLSLRFGLERLLTFLLTNGEKDKRVHIVFERRGKNEDQQLELEFLRICEAKEQFGYKKLNFNQLDFRPFFADKRSNSCGLQIADLTARPIGLSYLRPNQPNRAFEIIRPKLNPIKHFP